MSKEKKILIKSTKNIFDEEIKSQNLKCDFLELCKECKTNCNEYGKVENHRISSDGSIVSRLDYGGGFYRVTTMGMCEDTRATYLKWRDLNNSIFAKAQRENTKFKQDTDKKPTPRIDKWDKDRCMIAKDWAEKFSHKRLIYTRWMLTEDEGTQSFVSIEDDMLHFDLITRWPDFDIPEDGMDEIYAVLEKAQAEIDGIVKARLEYWREEERNGRL